VNREDWIRIAREAVGGLNRPSALCEASYTVPGSGEHVTLSMECEHSVRNPAAYDPPEWVIDAIRAAYNRGAGDAIRTAGHALTVNATGGHGGGGGGCTGSNGAGGASGQ